MKMMDKSVSLNRNSCVIVTYISEVQNHKRERELRFPISIGVYTQW
jgi:hypothetical protein